MRAVSEVRLGTHEGIIRAHLLYIQRYSSQCAFGKVKNVSENGMFLEFPVDYVML